MLYREHAFARNKTDVPQPIVNLMLAQFYVLPVMPGEYVLVKNAQVIIQPGQAFRVPIALWRSLSTRSWTEELTEEEYLALRDGAGGREPDLEEMTVKELRDIAESYGIELKPRELKDDLVAMIKEHIAAEDKSLRIQDIPDDELLAEAARRGLIVPLPEDE